MLQRFASTAFVVGALITALTPTVGSALEHGGNSGDGRSSPFRRSTRSNSNSRQSFSSGSRTYAPRSFSGGSHYSGGQSFVSPRGYDGRRGYSVGPSNYSRGYIPPRSYGRPVYRGPYTGGIYLGFGAPYGYTYDPGYVYGSGNAYDPSYSYGPAPGPQACVEGSYDRYGTWAPNPNCYSDQQQYPLPQQNYNSNQQQYQPPQRNYDPTQQYPQPEQDYDRNQQQYPPSQQNYDPNQSELYNR